MTLNLNTQVKKEDKKIKKKHIHYWFSLMFKGVIHHEFLIEIRTVNVTFYINVLKYLRDKMTGIFYSVQAGAFYQSLSFLGLF